MSKLLKLLGLLALGILGTLIGYYLIESKLFLPLKDSNPIDTAQQWMSSSVATPRILWLLALVWSSVTLPSAIFIWITARYKGFTANQVANEIAGIDVHSAYWQTDTEHRSDVTEIVRRLARSGITRFLAETKFDNGPFDDPHRGKLKSLIVDYSVGRERKTETVNEHEVFEFHT